MATALKPAVFLHSGFRSGSTWFWNRFREAAQSYAYYEPFNEKLALLTSDVIATLKASAWPSSGHPQLKAPYYDEYRPLLDPAGGVSLYNNRMAVRNYFDTDPNDTQRRYLEHLIHHAQSLERVPVLGFCRSFGRLPWFRRYCPGINIVTTRSPWNQWASCFQQAKKYNNFYFEFIFYMTAIIARNHEKYKSYFEDLFVVDCPSDFDSIHMKMIERTFKTLTVRQRIEIFFRVYTLEMLIALPYADLVVDLERMSDDAAYRATTTGCLRTMTGLADLSFADCSLPDYGNSRDPLILTCRDGTRNFLADYFTRHPPAAEQRPAIALVNALLAGRDHRQGS